MKICWATLLLVATAIPAWSQARFEVVSIRPSQPGMTARDSRMNFHGDVFEAKARTVGDLLDMLNDFQLFRISGGPDWMRSDRFDIEAKADRTLSPADLREAVKDLLAQRFQLKSHREKREVSGMVLRSPRTPAGIKEAGADEKYSMRMDGGAFVFTAASMSVLANYLSNLLTAPVLDETELKDKYNFKLAIRRGDSQSGTTWEDRAREAVEALGLRMENRRIPLEITVVDRCERPSEN